ncbi:aldehyde dehydrogenase family protein [Nocardiopsis sp. LOL_012]|uniref:aldehyde dehydrogenase family protein n=1 Tax=Nocardiopsis sp. LOL_012 TaxID=3345409 RepID=UPI003A84FAF5
MPVREMEILAGGRWLGSERTVDVYDPTDVREPAARVPALTADQVTGAYDAAEAGFAEWKRTSPFVRARIFTDTAALLRSRADDIARSLVTEMGKTLAEATGEVGKAADFFEYYSALAREGYGTLLHDARPGTRASVQREPIGVVLAITPWNDPLLTPARKLAPALAAGNAAVIKPASETPMSTLHLARALHDAGLPAGVLNVVTGRTAEISDALLDDPRIAALTFTGSNGVGERLRVRLADRNVRFQGELGGKNATVVLADADLEAAADTVMAAAFGQAGQRCTATSRLLVARQVHDRFVDLLCERLERLTVGPGTAEGTTMGPLVSPSQRDSVLADITRAVEQGALVRAGGDAPTDQARAHGCYVNPTLLVDVDPKTDVWSHEVFGPVLAVRAVDGFDEAVEAVNDSVYGLSAAIFTRDLAFAHRFVDEVECGQVAVNTATIGWDVHHPFGGFRDSGSAFKEQGTEALRFYTRVKTVAINTGS